MGDMYLNYIAMSTAEIVSYITSAKSQGVSENEIIERLQKLGWSKENITQAFATLPQNVAPPTNTSQQLQSSAPSQSPGMWDAFEHILLFISLYIMTTVIGFILNYFVDKWFPGIPDASSSYSYLSSQADSQLILLRGYLAALIVSVPLFSFFFLDITKRTFKNPLIRHIRSRKILIYLTLIITFLILVGEVIALIFTLLNGNVSLNFILHFLVTLVVSGIVFLYYLWQVKEDRKIHA
jgi:hypothetical protein